jgi:hypothetical protein
MGTVLNKIDQITTSEDSYSADSNQPSQCSDTTASQATVATKVNQHYDEISKALNPIELMPLLLKQQLLDFNERSVILENSKSTYEKSLYILQSLETKGHLAYSKFLSCVEAERNHMGHEYIAALLQEQPFGSKAELEESSRLKDAIQRHYSDPEMMDISLQSLVPLIYSKKLLTEEEQQKLLSHYKTRNESIHLLLHLLDTKGPLAHGLFVECLQSESSHPTHKELYDKLTSSCTTCTDVVPTTTSRKQKSTVDDNALAVALPRMHFFQRWELQGPLKGERYNRMMYEFHICNLDGDWERLETEAAKYKNFPIPEYEVVACHQLAFSWIIRGKPSLVVQHIDKAKKIVETKVYGENHRGLLYKCEIHLARLSRYLKDSEKAREHMSNAKELLYGIEAGRDSATVHYNEACIAAECLNELSTEKDFERVEELFTRAIFDDRSHECEPRRVEYHSLLRLAQIYLGSTHYTPGATTDDEKIRRASNCLNAVILCSLPQRSKCMYHLIESDLHRNCGKLDKAKESLDVALSISKKHNFELEINSAQIRLQSLHKHNKPPDPTMSCTCTS